MVFRRYELNLDIVFWEPFNMVYIAVINRQQENENSIYLKSYQELDIILEIMKFKKKSFFILPIKQV